MIRRKLFENFAHPRGLWGRLAGQVMARKTANVERGKWALAELDPGPTTVLELGYGPGLSLAEACAGRAAGHRRTVVRDASAGQGRNAGLRNGRLELRVGTPRLDADLSGLDLIYGINVWQFWTDQGRPLRPGRAWAGGRLALVYMQPPGASTTGDEAGERPRSSRRRRPHGRGGPHDAFDPPAVMVIGHRS